MVRGPSCYTGRFFTRPYPTVSNQRYEILVHFHGFSVDLSIFWWLFMAEFQRFYGTFDFRTWSLVTRSLCTSSLAMSCQMRTFSNHGAIYHGLYSPWTSWPLIFMVSYNGLTHEHTTLYLMIQTHMRTMEKPWVFKAFRCYSRTWRWDLFSKNGDGCCKDGSVSEPSGEKRHWEYLRITDFKWFHMISNNFTWFQVYMDHMDIILNTIYLNNIGSK